MHKAVGMDQLNRDRSIISRALLSKRRAQVRASTDEFVFHCPKTRGNLPHASESPMPNLGFIMCKSLNRSAICFGNDVSLKPFLVK